MKWTKSPLWWRVFCGLCLSLVVVSATAATREYYGSGVAFDVLDNMQVGRADVDYRFRAEHSGPVVSFSWFDAYGKFGADGASCDGYGCGTGGVIEVCIFNDDGTEEHLWSGHPLGCATRKNLRDGDRVRTDAFDTAPVLTKGALYHLHWHNADPNPDANYISVNDVCNWHPLHPRQPNYSDVDLAVLHGREVVETETPIFQIRFADGETQGQGYKESWNYAAETISGDKRAREFIHVTERDRVVTEVSVRINRASGNTPLRIELKDSKDAVLAHGEIAAERFPLGRLLTKSPRDSEQVNPVWATLHLNRPKRLRAGQTYFLCLSAAQGTVYQVYGIQRASGYGFSGRTYFADGRGEFTRDGGKTWSGFQQADFSVDHKDADLQFYFAVKCKRVR